MDVKNIALQLYSIRDLMAQDVFATLKEVARAGYTGVEFAGFFGVEADALRTAMDDLGLACAGSHTGVSLLQPDSLESTIEYNLSIGNRIIVCPGLPKEMTESADAYKRTAEFFNQVGRRLSEHNMRLFYHNHAVEFEQHGGEYGLDILMRHTEPRFFGMELDTYWVHYAGLRAVDFIEKYKERCSLLHLKDMKDDENRTCTELGRGVLNFPEIIATGRKYGVMWYIVEQEHFDIPELESIAVSAAYLHKHL